MMQLSSSMVYNTWFPLEDFVSWQYALVAIAADAELLVLMLLAVC